MCSVLSDSPDPEAPQNFFNNHKYHEITRYWLHVDTIQLVLSLAQDSDHAISLYGRCTQALMLMQVISHFYFLTAVSSPACPPMSPITDPESSDDRNHSSTRTIATRAYKYFIIPRLRFQGRGHHSVNHLELGNSAVDATIFMEIVAGLLHAVIHFNSNNGSSDLAQADRVLETFNQLVVAGWEAKHALKPVQREFVDALRDICEQGLNMEENSKADLPRVSNDRGISQQLGVVPAAALVEVLQPVIDALSDEECIRDAQDAIYQLRCREINQSDAKSVEGDMPAGELPLLSSAGT